METFVVGTLRRLGEREPYIPEQFLSDHSLLHVPTDYGVTVAQCSG